MVLVAVPALDGVVALCAVVGVERPEAAEVALVVGRVVEAHAAAGARHRLIEDKKE